MTLKKSTKYFLNNQPISYSVEKNGYTVYVGNEVYISQHEPIEIEFDYEDFCMEQVKAIATSTSQIISEQDQLNAELLLNQATILENQQAHDEVLAEILLNQAGGNENV